MAPKLAYKPKDPSTWPLARYCTVCVVKKTLATDFGALLKGKYGRKPKCKTCVNDAAAIARSTPRNKAKRREYSQRWLSNPENKRKHAAYQYTPKGLYRMYEKGAKKRGLPFYYTLVEFTRAFWQQPCSYCGDVLEFAGVDRVDSSRGYTKDNSVPCCSTCNFMKLKSSKEAFLAKCRQIILHNERKKQDEEE